MQPMQYDSDQGRLIPTGHLQEVTGDRQILGRKTADAAYDYAIKSETHLWIVLVEHRASDQVLDAVDGIKNEMPILDADTMNGPPVTCCYVCEIAYDPTLRRRKCPGEPKDQS